jgi:hypothetical protein
MLSSCYPFRAEKVPKLSFFLWLNVCQQSLDSFKTHFNLQIKQLILNSRGVYLQAKTRVHWFVQTLHRFRVQLYPTVVAIVDI